jgi:hypothetical protein
MFDKAAKHKVSARFLRKASDFRSDERGSITIFVMLLFVMMVLVGGIAVDIMRSELRRVTYQQTFDRAVLAASNVVLPVSQTPQSVGQDWYSKAGLGDQFTVDYGTPVITGQATTSSRFARVSGTVRSYNWFMHSLNVPYFDMPITSRAQQGISKIEVMLVLDITGSMSGAAGSTTKIEALRAAATNFLTVMKFSRDTAGNFTIPKDPNNLVSIGMVPYASNVNIPVALRSQFTNLSDLSSWDGVNNVGVPNANCLEIPVDTYSQTGLSRTAPISMAPVALAWSNPPTLTTNTSAADSTSGGVITLNRSSTPSVPSRNTDLFVCNHGDNFSTADDPNTVPVENDESASNLLAMPSTNITPLQNQIALLNPRGRTSIAVGMRWATALLDQSAREIYSNILTEAAMAGRPADNNDNTTRKIIVVMTDGNHVASENVFAFKTGPSPIWRGSSDRRLVIRYTDGGPALTGGLRPGLTAGTNTCSGWVIGPNREFFAPHLKQNFIQPRFQTTDAEGVSSGTAPAIEGACDPRAWLSSATGTPSWTGSGTVRQLDWSEVWRYASVDWVIRHLYMRSGVAGTNNYSTVYNQFVAPYLGTASYMDTLLDTNCTAAKNAGIEVFGIVLGNSVNQVPIQRCASPGTGYYYLTNDAASLTAAFERIAVLISDLKLTQ